jgi:PPOX class probable F420-dependent enzyme
MSHRRRSIEAGLYPVTKSAGKKERRTTMAIVLPDTVTRLLDGRNFAHLATIMSDGSPHCAPVWVGREGDRIIICTDEDSVKGRNTRRDPRVAVSIVDMDDPYSEAQLRGRVTERRAPAVRKPA